VLPEIVPRDETRHLCDDRAHAELESSILVAVVYLNLILGDLPWPKSIRISNQKPEAKLAPEVASRSSLSPISNILFSPPFRFAGACPYLQPVSGHLAFTQNCRVCLICLNGNAGEVLPNDVVPAGPRVPVACSFRGRQPIPEPNPGPRFSTQGFLMQGFRCETFTRLRHRAFRGHAPSAEGMIVLRKPVAGPEQDGARAFWPVSGSCFGFALWGGALGRLG
jgi:hypothetical protein